MKSFICIGFGISYTYNTEVYSTEYRGIGMGCSVLIGRLGGILAPFVANYLIDIGFYP